MSDSMSPRLEDQLCFTIYSASLAITQCYKPRLMQLDLTYPQYLVLLILFESDSVNLKTICHRLGQKPGALTPVVKRLEAVGYLQRTPSQADERSIDIRLTAEGRLLEPKLASVREDIAGIWQALPEQALLDQAAALRANAQQLLRDTSS